MGQIQREPGRPPTAAPRALDILLVNNAEPPALRPTTQRFEALLAAACAPGHMRLRVTALPAAARLLATGPDAVVVTGAEPAALSLRDEPGWPALAALFAAAERHAVPLLLSCMASHAAVLHATGIERRRLPHKLFGLYPERHAGPGALLAGLPDPLPMPHSRWNTLPEPALAAAPDIRILTRSAAGGAGVFAIARDAPWLCLQGHPEYGATTLAAEYQRDLARHRDGALAAPPDPPGNGASPTDAAAAARWQAHGARIVANWLAACGLGRVAHAARFADAPHLADGGAASIGA